MVLETEPPLTAKDWRGKEIKVGTRVMWHNGEWGIGAVTKISRDYYGEILLGVRWDERSSTWRKSSVGKATYSIRGRNCVVWAIQEEDL